ncbi:TraB/GumN family protein [Oceanibium sediminis]|uniref:TraB/GumN family protein n=1 Tax=Oceanibium sediminis TaxID=2026339 RepID=UPI00130060A6|nr:TraB/GumN family protein [Oceanibium sediminis]
MHLVRALSVFVLSVFTPAAYAACNGIDLSADWTPDFRAEVEQMANAEPYPEGRFFEVTKNGASSVIFGTIHLSEDAVATPPAALMARLAEAEELLIEITREEEQRMMRNLILNPEVILAAPDRRLSDSLLPAEWAAITELAAPLGIDADLADQIAPWFLMITLSNPACVLEDQYSGKQILDRRIEAGAKARDIPVSGLESFDDVFGLFSDVPYDEQVEMLRMGLPSYTMAEDFLETTKQLYLAGKVMQIWSFSMVLTEDAFVEAASATAAMQAAETFTGLLLEARNTAWVQTLRPKLEQGNRVIAVGALHLGGTGGLLDLLEAEGFAIRRLDG